MRVPAPPRVAFFPDSFHEVNGVAHTARHFLAFAQRRRMPFLCIHAGPRLTPEPLPYTAPDDCTHELELPRSRLAVGVEKDLAFDPIFARHRGRVERALRQFRPDLIHITGPSELGLLGAYFAWRLRIPLAASWHTNIHEYAARRMMPLLSRALPERMVGPTAARVEAITLHGLLQLYRHARVLFAPNPELCDLLERRTGRRTDAMQRGVDTDLFHPAPASAPSSPPYTLGFVGRLSVEKNVDLLPVLHRQLTAAGIAVRFLIVGHGEREAWLRSSLPDAEFTGVLRGEALAAAYRRMDLFVFPSRTDTFGNVVLEALASGVPAVVTPSGGPQSILGSQHPGSTQPGAIAEDNQFMEAIATLLGEPARLVALRRAAARARALSFSWDAVFEQVYGAYRIMEPHSLGDRAQ